MVTEIAVLDKGFVRLDDYLAGDEMVVRAARVSFNRQDDDVTDAAARGLINFLMKNRHGSPFEHNVFIFHVKAPIFVFREWHRHRIGWSYNEWSGRYSKIEPEWYVPEEGHVRSQEGKPGAYTYVTEGDPDRIEDYRLILDTISRKSHEVYDVLLREGYAKEIARFSMTINTYSQMYATCNARSLMAFLDLRTHQTALREIRDYADELETLFASVMPITHQAWVDNGRVAP